MIDILCALDTLSGYIRHGRLHRFTFRVATGAQVERILRSYGVPQYGRGILRNGDRTFLVPARQAVWAEYLLIRSDIPLTSRRINRRHKAGPMPQAWGVGVRHPSFVARIAKWMGV